MLQPSASPQCVQGEKEPGSIMFLGYQKHGQRTLDFGQTEAHDDDDVYRRMTLSFTKGESTVQKDFLVYVGKMFEVAAGESQ